MSYMYVPKVNLTCQCFAQNTLIIIVHCGTTTESSHNLIQDLPDNLLTTTVGDQSLLVITPCFTSLHLLNFFITGAVTALTSVERSHVIYSKLCTTLYLIITCMKCVIICVCVSVCLCEYVCVCVCVCLCVCVWVCVCVNVCLCMHVVHV